MFRTSLLAAIASLCLLLPTRLFAGGPPCLCLPIDGVTADNVKACKELLTANLKNKLSNYGERNGIQLQQRVKQWYVMFYMANDVGLHEVEAALSGSKYSIPRDRLHLFGHVVLEIDVAKSAPKEVLAKLDALDQVSVVESQAKKDRLTVTLDMPYPDRNVRPDSESANFDRFQRNDLSSEQSTRSAAPIAARMLPSYNAVREIVTKHNANLKDVRWSTNHACRTLGCVAVPDQVVEVSAKPTVQIGPKQ